MSGGAASAPLLDAEAIRAILPHREPILLVDRILELEPGNSILGARTVSNQDPWLAGHFPGHPVMPGVLVIEALAQTGAVLMLHGAERGDRLPFFAGIDRARFRRPVRPGDELLLALTVTQQRPGSCKMHGVARVGEDLAAEAEIFAVLRSPA